MMPSRKWWRLLGIAALLTTAISLSQAQDAGSASIGVPTGIMNAKSVFVSNGGSDAGLFPEPFTGDPNRGYFAFEKALEAAHTYDLVDDPGQADLVLELHLSAPMGPVHMSKQLGSADALPFFKLTIYDRKTHFVLWTITEPIDLAFLQKTHDKNFDQALSHVVDDLQALSKPGPGSLYPHPPARQSGWTK